MQRKTRTRTRQIPSHDRLKRDYLGLLYEHRAAIELVSVLFYFIRHFIDICSNEVVWDDVA